MKTLKQHINEWKVSDQSMKNIVDNKEYFIYELARYNNIKIFDNDWIQFDDYKNKVYDENGNFVELNEYGETIKEYSYGIHKFYIKDIDTITNCGIMFLECKQLISVPLFNTSKVEDMHDMFTFCNLLKEVPLFNTSKVKTMSSMFYKCEHIKSVPLFNTSKVEDMWGMFTFCGSLEKVPLFNTSNVEDMHEMFYKCYYLKEVPLFDTTNVINMEDMFNGCDNLNKKTKQNWSKVYDFDFGWKRK